jgi:hypothetical protein
VDSLGSTRMSTDACMVKGIISSKMSLWFLRVQVVIGTRCELDDGPCHRFSSTSINKRRRRRRAATRRYLQQRNF